MPFNIEIISIGGDFDQLIVETTTALNGVQEEFVFKPVPKKFLRNGAGLIKIKYHTSDVYDLLRKYRTEAKGHRPYMIGLIDKKLESDELKNIFGSHNGMGDAVITLHDREHFVESAELYLCYYLIRYALSFVSPSLKNHKNTRSCFFDKKLRKADIKKSLDSGAFCRGCTKTLWKSFNDEINAAIKQMVEVMKSLRADSQASLAAGSLRGQIDIGIITIREDEYEAMLDHFPARRHVQSGTTDYQYSKVQTNAKEKLRIVVARSPAQGQGAAQALASSMISELSPSWIFLVGIAGGFPASEFTLGDVLLSQRLHDFAVSAAIEDKPHEFQDMGGPMVLVVERLVTGLKGRRAQLGHWNQKASIGKTKPNVIPPNDVHSVSLYGGADWKKDVIKSLKAHFPRSKKVRPPDFFAAVIIDGNTLVKDTKLAKQWRQNARHASAVEMELGGVCRAARYGADGRTKVLAIRGLSDIVGYKRSPDWTEYACRSASAFASALIQSGIIRRGE